MHENWDNNWEDYAVEDLVFAIKDYKKMEELREWIDDADGLPVDDALKTKILKLIDSEMSDVKEFIVETAAKVEDD